MPSSKGPSVKFENLRQQAQDLIQKNPDLATTIPLDIIDLIHELRIHQTELEIQNEELQRSHTDLADARREYANLYEFAPCGYLTLDTKGLISRVNLTAAAILGKTRQFILGSGFISHIGVSEGKVYQDALHKAAATGEKQSIELPLKNKDTVVSWVRAEIEAEFNAAGEVSQWRMILLDISAAKTAERALQASQAKLAQAQKMESIGNLAGGIAHDFNNILASILGFTELALEEVAKNSNIEEYLGEIYTSGTRAKELVMRILTFARKTNETIGPVKIKDIFSESISLLRSVIPSNIEIKHNIDSDATVFCNQVTCQQVILNLVKNAVDAMETLERGAVDIAVRDVDVDEDFANEHGLLGPGKHVQITVSDTGSGIAPEELDKIFEPYYTTKETGKGTGLGLALVHGTVTKYGGSIMVDSQLGQGSVFTILLPSSSKIEERKISETEELPGGSETILLVDDELPIVKLTQQNLKKLGYRVIGTTDSREALEIFRADPHKFHLVISDMTMPHITGDKMAIELMKIRADIPVIISTGFSNRMSSETASEMDIKALVSKPVSKKDLANTIRRVLDQAGEEQNL